MTASGWTARRDGYEISTDHDRLDLDAIHGFLVTAYWSRGVPREVVERSIAHSLPFGLYGPDGRLAGFARVITDRATFAYIGDVFVLEPHRGRGLGAWLVEAMLAHPWMQGLRRIHLATEDAQALYERFGFRATSEPHKRLDLVRRPTDLWDAPDV
jgi:GNAT superfamily N-acetyltransferase